MERVLELPELEKNSTQEINEVRMITNDFQEIRAGRRVVLEFPMGSAHLAFKTVVAVILDSVTVNTINSSECAALLVPHDKLEEWVYSSEGGQWQLLAAAGVSRLIVLLPVWDPVDESREQEGSPIQRKRSDGWPSVDEELHSLLRPLVFALTPKILFSRGVPDIPFITYADNVARRLEIEIIYSPISGWMRVEDVELVSISEVEGRTVSRSKTSLISVKELASPQLLSPSPVLPTTNLRKTWRRRLVFKRMPNLIQTEVALIQDLDRSKKQRRGTRKSGRGPKQAAADVKRVDHSRLVHKYLPPMVAGFVLISPRLDECRSSQRGPKVLCIGMGGGALPTFLHHQFGFHIRVVDIDEVVVELAKRYFSLKEGPNFEVTVGDGLDAVSEIAGGVVGRGLVHDELQNMWIITSADHKSTSSHSFISKDEPVQEFSGSLSASCTLIRDVSPAKVNLCGKQEENRINELNILCDNQSTNDTEGEDGMRGIQTSICLQRIPRNSSSKQGRTAPSSPRQSLSSKLCNSSVYEENPRFEIIIVDVDVGDPRMELSAPPLAFIERKFLLSARIALVEGGMLVINVVPCSKRAYDDVIQALTGIFAEVYVILLENDINRVLFALTRPVLQNYFVGPVAEQVKGLVDGRLIQQIRRVVT